MGTSCTVLGDGCVQLEVMEVWLMDDTLFLVLLIFSSVNKETVVVEEKSSLTLSLCFSVYRLCGD